MRQYSVQGINASGTGPATAFNLVGATTIRPRIRSLNVGVLTAPNATDQQARYQLGNTTAAGTAGSSPTPKPMDPQDVAAQVTAGITHSVEPTYGTAFFVDHAINQRGAKEWRWDDGYEPTGAAVASNGIGGKLASVTAAAQLLMPVEWRE